MLAELIAILDALAGGAGAPSVIVEDVAEPSVVVCLGFAAYALYRSEREEVNDLRRPATTDELTNLPNRSFLRRVAARRLELSAKNDLPLSCAVLDIDDFKDYNDRYGHEEGDEALRCVARALERSTRADDAIARYGGEEFVLLMNGSPEKAATVAERVRREVEASCSPERDPRLRRAITASLGVASLTEEKWTLEEFLDAADREMYHAKRAGKNRVSVARGSSCTV